MIGSGYEYKCYKCKKTTYHYLPLRKCDCGGKLRYIYKPAEWPLREKIELGEPTTTFIPVRLFGGYGDIWYYRRKPRKKIKILKKSF